VASVTIQGTSDHVTGLRGLTTIANPNGKGEILMASIEDNPARIVRIQPDKGFQVDDDLPGGVTLSQYLTTELGTRATYGIPAYNKMTVYPNPVQPHCPSLLFGFEISTPDAPNTFPPRPTQSRPLWSPNAHYLSRDCDGNYALQTIPPALFPKPMVSTRDMLVSPFPEDAPGTIYACGFDVNPPDMITVHNTSWIAKGLPPSNR
jgi:hypothetical protein